MFSGQERGGQVDPIETTGAFNKVTPAVAPAHLSPLSRQETQKMSHMKSKRCFHGGGGASLSLSQHSGFLKQCHFALEVIPTFEEGDWESVLVARRFFLRCV